MRMMASLLSSLVIVFFLPLQAGADKHSGYIDVPNAAEREVPGSGWEPYPFATLNLIDEMTGRDFAGASLIADKEIFRLIQKGEFAALELSHLTIRSEDAVVYSDADGKNSWTSIPFAISVRYTRKNSSLLSPFHGILECAGEIRIHQADSHVEIGVGGFSDSTPFEWFARKLGLFDDINLHFARAVVEPILLSYFNKDSTPAELLLGMLNQSHGRK